MNRFTTERDALQRSEREHARPLRDVRPRQSLTEDVERRLLIQRQIVDRCALEALTPLGIGFEGDRGDIAALMSYPDRVGEVGQSPRRHHIDQRRFRDTPCSMLPRGAEQEELRCLADDFAGLAAGPGADGTVEPVPLPPRRILSGDVDGELHRGGQRLAGLVAGHQQPFPVLRPRCMEVSLLRVWPVIGEPVLR